MKKFLVGSRLLKINKEDSDFNYVYILDNESEITKKDQDSVDIRLCGTITQLMPYFNLDLTKNLLLLRGMYQLDADIIGECFPYKYHFVEHYSKAKLLLESLLGFHLIYKDKCKKQVYHIQYMLFMLQNKSGKLTEEQLEVVKKIYNKQMPAEYLEKIRLDIKNL